MTDYAYQPLAPIPANELKNLDFVRPDGRSRCTWTPGADMDSAPHTFQSHTEKPKIMPNILHAVGNTPLVRLNKIPKSFGIKCEMLAKCEYFNPAGSVKDRIALRMVEDAEKQGLLKPGDTIIEPSSGNTGLGLAIAAAVKGYRCIIVMPLKMSNEKVDTLKALGAQVIRTPTAAAFDSPEGLMAVAQKLCKEIPNSIILDQYRNSCNPIAHYEHTCQEIIDQCEGKIDAIVCGAGTGGTICGIGRKIKDNIPSCKVIAADPLGSILSLPQELNKTDISFYEVEGIGYDFIPTVLDRTVVDEWYKTNDKDSLTMARMLIKEEGLLCGGSSGSAMSVAIQVAKTMSEGQRLVVLLPDGMRNYMSKFITDSWLKIRDFKNLDEQQNLWWSNKPVSVLHLRTPKVVPCNTPCSVAFNIMKKCNLDYIFVTTNGNITGAVNSDKILMNLTEGKNELNDELDKFSDPVRTVETSAPLGKISFITQKEKIVLVNCSDGIKYATSFDLLNFITSSAN
ncbi:hypothetical protein RUM44_000453 [Polyplax serrata]|uniref:Cystathionine beta-synthase n=1 Tax=Polyplax serrata TaxID=468196 RepID=A0ABR1B840_POLSC